MSKQWTRGEYEEYHETAAELAGADKVRVVACEVCGELVNEDDTYSHDDVDGPVCADCIAVVEETEK